VLVAIEGTDLTGKSTLAAELADAWGARVIHAGPPPKRGSLVAYEDPLIDHDVLGGEHLILDRWHVGEYVWPAIFRRPTDYIDPAIRRHVEMFMCSRGCTVVYATRNYDEHRQALADSDEPLRPSHLARALDLFDDALNEGQNRGFAFDHDHERLHLSPQDVEFVAGQAFDDVAQLHGATSRWIGHPQPRYAIAVHGCSDTEIPGRTGDGLDPTLAQVLRALPKRAWRGFAVVDTATVTPDQLWAWAQTANPHGWIAMGEDAFQALRGLDCVWRNGVLSVPYGSATLGDLPGAISRWMDGDDKW
jgi:hypothetical protein